MPNRLTLFTGFLLLLTLGGSVLMTIHYQHLATDWKNTAQQNQQALTIANTALYQQQHQQRQVAALDKQHTEELAYAKITIEDLRHAVAAGSKRLQVNAHCPASDRNGDSSPPSVVDVASPRLTDAAKRHYFALRQRIATTDKQIAGLQDYIKWVCLKSAITTK
jgi:prophage endopeptidase